MSPHDPLVYLKTLLSKDFEAHKYKSSKEKPRAKEPLVITLSRDYGALGEEIARELASCLGIPVYDQEVIDRVAKASKTDKFYVEQHDERSQAGVSGFLYSLISGTTSTVQGYRRALFDVVLDLARSDCLIVGRGAHLILKNKKVFRLRVVGSREACAARVVAAEGLSLEAAEAKVHEVNNKRHKAINTLYEHQFEGSTLEHAVNFDLVINTDHFTAQGAALIVIMALEQAGYDLQRTERA
jgi:hypothetical protein